MRFIIIEDEQIAANRLRKLIQSLRPNYEFVTTVDSVEGASISLAALKFDLLFMDIQLADGLSFEIFDNLPLKKPVIFTTAYDQYAIRAFKTNGVDYLLKPIDEDELENAIIKFEERFIATKSSSEPSEMSKDIKQVLEALSEKKNFKERFVVKIGDHLKSIPVGEIAFFYSQDKTTFLVSNDNRTYIIDFPLDRLVELIDPGYYFRISRKFLIGMDCIDDILSFTNSRLKLKIKNFQDENVIVARERVQEFKQWLDK